MSTRSNRFSGSFQPLRNPSLTMRTLKTAFSPTRSSRSASATSYSSTSTTSPLTQSRDPSGSGSYSRASSPQSDCSRHSLAELLAVRRRPSSREFEMEMESRTFGSELHVLEPRPFGVEHAGVVGIFEVLDGKC